MEEAQSFLMSSYSGTKPHSPPPPHLISAGSASPFPISKSFYSLYSRYSTCMIAYTRYKRGARVDWIIRQQNKPGILPFCLLFPDIPFALSTSTIPKNYFLSLINVSLVTFPFSFNFLWIFFFSHIL